MRTMSLLLGAFLLWPLQSVAAEPIWVAPVAGDSGPVIRDAIAKAMAAGPGAEVRLRAGVFRIASAADDNWFVVIGGANDLTVSGEIGKTQVVFSDPTKGGFLVADGMKVTIRGITVDYDPPPFTQGTIAGVDQAKNEFELHLDEGFPSPDERWFATGTPVSQMGVLFDPTERRLKRGVPDYFFATSWRQKSGRVWTVHLSDTEPGKAKYVATGDRFALLSRRGNGAFLFAGTRDCLLENVTVRASPSLTVSLTGSDHMTIRGLVIACERGSSRLIASTGDGVHCQQNRNGPLIENCLFEGLCDDGVNIYSVPLVVKQVISPTQLALTDVSPVRPGDRLQVFDPQKGVIRGEPLAKTVEYRDGMQIVTFDHPVEGVIAGSDHRTADTVFNLSASGAGYVIRGNHFRNHRRFGVNLRGGNGVVQGNAFEETGGYGVSVGNEPTWPEGPAASNVVIRGNLFIGGAYSAGYGDGKGGPGIRVCGLSLNGVATPPLLHQITIEDNCFYRPYSPAIEVRSVRGIVIRGNGVSNARGTPVKVTCEMSEQIEIDSR